MYPLVYRKFAIEAVRAFALISASLCLLIFWYLWRESLPIIQGIPLTKLIQDTSWHPIDNQYSLLPIVVGTLLVGVGTFLLATPLGVLIAIFIQFYCSTKSAWFFQQWLALMSGIPSVVYGFWGLLVLVPSINLIHPPGASLLAGLLILTLMVFPFTTLTTLAAFQIKTPSLNTGAEALGLSRYTQITQIVLPACKQETFNGMILQTTRALGETMALLMVCGNVVQFPKSIFDPIRTLTVNMALEMAYATGTIAQRYF